MTNEGYSKEWIDFMQKENDFRRAAGNYNQNIDLEIQKKDILLSLTEYEGALITTRLMSEGFIRDEVVEQVWERLVYLVFHGNVSVSSWSFSSLKGMSYDKKKKYKDQIGRLALEYAEEAGGDDISLRLGLQLLYEMGCKDVVEQYMEKYKEVLVLDEEDIEYYQNVK